MYSSGSTCANCGTATPLMRAAAAMSVMFWVANVIALLNKALLAFVSGIMLQHTVSMLQPQC